MPTAARPNTRRSRLSRFPVGSFGIVVGLCSAALLEREAARVLELPRLLPAGLTLLALTGLVVVVGLYTAKLLFDPTAVRVEFADPVAIQLFPTLTISLLLLPLVISPHLSAVLAPLWVGAASAHFVLMIAIARRWILQKYRVGTFMPAWFLSVGGTLVAAMTGARLGYVEPAWFFLCTGLVMCGSMLTIALYRLVFHDRMSAALAPTLFILLTPPSAGFLAYIQLNGGQLDVLSRTLFYLALFIAATLIGLAPVFLRARFSLSWWAFTFPSAALSMATLRYHELLGSNASLGMALVALCIAVGLFWITALRTAAWLLHRLAGDGRTHSTTGGAGASAIGESVPVGARKCGDK